MRPHVLVAFSVLAGALGAVAGTVLALTKPTCFVTEICRVDLRRGGGCLPITCDRGPALLELWVSIGIAAVIGLLIAVALEAGRLHRSTLID